MSHDRFAAAVTAALDRLPADQREVLLAKDAEGLSYAAIAARLGIREDAAQTLYATAMIALRRATEPPPP
ncbi:sigma-70 region 4 domain-containing protein [Sphingomonas sp. PL-96]|uniref:RNA polymerase sigma factor n=1 Tax=Sphingomonas sp. PL-96 TaxID=2887201 RepID=UPI001E5041E8|nr:sigma-70 region 4 domain-containing protein [Sphingomonas sp. PL-96]MCC2976643.1 sigma-70 region 4 domain-containing protein [Sphingomonas sp. PL-96]